MRRPLAVAAALLLVSGAAGSAAAAAPGARPLNAAASVQVPEGVTASAAVFDRQTGTFTEQLNTSTRFRSASVVKLLLALDFLWDRGPDYTVPAADRALLEPMLRSSDDDAAGHYWVENGKAVIITRMAGHLGLTDTDPPRPPVTRATGATSRSPPATP